MSDNGPCCAHLRVLWVTEDLPNGLTRGWWECDMCKTKFAPVMAPHCPKCGSFRLRGECGHAWEIPSGR